MHWEDVVQEYLGGKPSQQILNSKTVIVFLLLFVTKIIAAHSQSLVAPKSEETQEHCDSLQGILANQFATSFF